MSSGVAFIAKKNWFVVEHGTSITKYVKGII